MAERKPPTSVTKKKTITVSTSMVEAVAKWAGTDVNRTRLHQVLFSEDQIVAVDGHRLVSVPCPTYGQTIGVERRYLLAVVAAQRAMKIGSPHQITLESDGTQFVRLGFGSSDGSSMAAMVVKAANTADFPDYKTVIRDGIRAKPAGKPDGYRFNASYMGAIHEVEEAMSSVVALNDDVLVTDCGVHLVAWGDDKVSPMVFKGRMGVTYIIMPMRG